MTSAAPSLEGLSLEKLDVISPAHYEQNGYPHAEWTYLRKHAPVHRFTGEAFDPFYAIVKHADIVEIGKNPTDFIIEPRLAVFTREIPPDQVKLKHLLTLDPPEHRWYRAVTAKQFTPRMVQQWQPKVERITRQILDQAGERGACDFVQDVAAPITIAVIAEMLGVPGDDWRLLFKWTNETIAPEDPEFQQGRTTEETIMSARTELFKYFSALSEERRKRPQDDIVSVVATGKVEGKLLEAFDLLSYYLLLVVAGNETTRNAMTGGMLAFYDNRDEWRRLVANPGLVDSAVEEIVRWTTPVIQFTRETTRDFTLRGVRIPKGESLCLFYGSANRDEEIFDEPFRFRIDRDPNDHVGFGRGEHVCLGAHLARLELRTVFDQIRARLESFERTGKEERVRSSFVGGIKRAPIQWKLRPAERG
ncbi:MAG TPA: cytochrome P450 [Myxococcota bacterium]|nr:cytochrome P450 [Myxococcota bacterium]